MSEGMIYFLIAAAAGLMLIFLPMLRLNRKKVPKPRIDVGRTTATLQLADGSTKTVSRDGNVFYDYYIRSEYRVERALSQDWITMDDGTIFNRNHVVSYSMKTEELWMDEL